MEPLKRAGETEIPLSVVIRFLIGKFPPFSPSTKSKAAVAGAAASTSAVNRRSVSSADGGRNPKLVSLISMTTP